MPSALSLRLDARWRDAGIDVVQGVGDTYWVWQKLVRHVPVMNFNILVTSDDHLQGRAIEFLKLLPKVGEVRTKRVTQAVYDRACAGRTKIKDVIEHRASEYSVNNWLENGIRLDGIDPEYLVEWEPGFQVDGTAPSYDLMYVSGSKPEHTEVWTPAQWASLFAKSSLKSVVLIGAPYDNAVQLQVSAELAKLGIKAQVMTDRTPAETVKLIRAAKSFTGYQSGLNIIADAYDIPQVMVYFPHLKPMLNTWCKPGHAGTLFHAFTFDQTPEQVADELRSPGR